MHILALPFWDSNTRRLRAFWRLLIQVALMVIVLLVLVVVGVTLTVLLSGGFAGGGNMQQVFTNASNQFQQNRLGSEVAEFAAFVGTVLLAARLIDRRKLANLGFHINRGWWIDLVFGLVLGAALMGLIFAVELAAGWVTITGSASPGATGQPFVLAFLIQIIVYIGVGIQEETFSRGYQLKNIAEGLRLGKLDPRVAVVLGWVLSSTVFGLLHLRNPNATLVSTFNIVLAGLFLGLGALLTGELAIGIGLHITWNLFEGNVFGFLVSGTGGADPTLIAIRQGGPIEWTGGPFGPEAGLVCILALMVGSAAILAWVRYRRGKLAIFTPIADPPMPAAAAAAPAEPQ